MGADLALNYYVLVYSITEVASVRDSFITPDKKVRVLLNSEEVTTVTIYVVYWRRLKACGENCELLVKHHFGLFGIKVLDSQQAQNQNQFTK